jgi:plastocyanin
MRVNGLPYYGIHVEPGDKLRSNATYDTTLQSTYEDMGIVVSLLVPDKADGTPQAPGLNPFTAPVDETVDCVSGGLKAATPTLCPNGILETHGHYSENAHRGEAAGEWNVPADGPLSRNTNEIGIADFLYTPGDLSTADTLGVPTVPINSNLRFTNLDGGAVLHTITTCKFPCLGPTGAAFPIGDGQTSAGRQIDLDSGQLGYSVPQISGAKEEAQWSIPVTQSEGYQPGEVVTYFCRIHPSMRGAFEVGE